MRDAKNMTTDIAWIAKMNPWENPARGSPQTNRMPSSVELMTWLMMLASQLKALTAGSNLSSTSPMSACSPMPPATTRHGNLRRFSLSAHASASSTAIPSNPVG